MKVDLIINHSLVKLLIPYARWKFVKPEYWILIGSLNLNSHWLYPHGSNIYRADWSTTILSLIYNAWNCNISLKNWQFRIEILLSKVFSRSIRISISKVKEGWGYLLSLRLKIKSTSLSKYNLPQVQMLDMNHSIWVILFYEKSKYFYGFSRVTFFVGQGQITRLYMK